MINKNIKEYVEQLYSTEINFSFLPGGINNWIYLIDLKGHDRKKIVIKIFPSNNREYKKRLNSEILFLQLAARRAAIFVPKVLHINKKLNFIIIEYLGSRSHNPSVEAIVPINKVNSAITFYRLINREDDYKVSQKFPLASESCTDIAQHHQLINKKIEMLTVNHLPNEFKQRYTTVLVKLKKSWDFVSSISISAIESGLVENPIMPSKMQISPGDFGFHNTITSETQIKFLDFEFAGLDDPAKTLCDFLIHPGHSLNDKSHEKLLEGFAINLSKIELGNRLLHTKNLYKVNWLIIILSVLNSERFISYIERIDNLSEFLDARLLRFQKLYDNKLNFRFYQ